MKLVQITLVNLATVVVALVVYDQLRGRESDASAPRASSSRSDLADSVALERRFREIEAKLAALPKNEAWDKAVFKQLADARKSAAKPDSPAPERMPGEATPTSTASTDTPTKAEVARFRELQDAVRRENSVKKNWERINRQLDKAGVNLTPVQRERVHHAWADFEPRIMRIWGDIKTQARETVEAGGEIDRKSLGEQGNAQIQSEFAAALSGIVNHQADAEAVAAALTPRGK